jgi:hypothetical protein
MKDHFIKLRVTAEQKARIAVNAKTAGVSVSQFVINQCATGMLIISKVKPPSVIKHVDNSFCSRCNRVGPVANCPHCALLNSDS